MLGRTQAEQFLGRSTGPFGIPNSLGVLMALLIPPVGWLVFAARPDGRCDPVSERPFALAMFLATGFRARDQPRGVARAGGGLRPQAPRDAGAERRPPPRRRGDRAPRRGRDRRQCSTCLVPAHARTRQPAGAERRRADASNPLARRMAHLRGAPRRGGRGGVLRRVVRAVPPRWIPRPALLRALRLREHARRLRGRRVHPALRRGGGHRLALRPGARASPPRPTPGCWHSRSISPSIST